MSNNNNNNKQQFWWIISYHKKAEFAAKFAYSLKNLMQEHVD